MSLYKHFPESDFLMHYGVKGMKWRKHKKRTGINTELNQPTYAGNLEERFKNMSPEEKAEVHDQINTDLNYLYDVEKREEEIFGTNNFINNSGIRKRTVSDAMKYLKKNLDRLDPKHLSSTGVRQKFNIWNNAQARRITASKNKRGKVEYKMYDNRVDTRLKNDAKLKKKKN